MAVNANYLKFFQVQDNIWEEFLIHSLEKRYTVETVKSWVAITVLEAKQDQNPL